MTSSGLLDPYKLGTIHLKNRVVMSPMTRSRAIGNTPGPLMAEFYRQRAGAGLIITEGTAPSPNGLGYSRIPGIYSREQVEGWKVVTETVHAEGGRIFLQIMHTGRISHPANMPILTKVFAPSAVRAAGQMWTDAHGLLDFPIPRAMDLNDIAQTKKEFTDAAANAIEAGFDGVELHAANGYLLEEFLNPASNVRTDLYGGNVGNRCRFLMEVVEEVAKAVGKERVGVRVSPFGIASDMPPYPEVDATYKFLARHFDRVGIVYLHLVDHSSMGAPIVPSEIKTALRHRFSGALILSGGYTKVRAEKDLRAGLADLIAFGRPFINNPDLVKRFTNNWPVSEDLDMKTFYTAGEKGYTDYPVFARNELANVAQP